MSGTIKGVLLFFTGAGLGTLGSAFFFYRRSQKACKEFEERCSEEYAEMRAEFLSSKDYKNENLEKSRGEDSEKTVVTPRQDRIDYTKYSKEPESIESIIKRAEEKAAEEESPIEEDEKKNKLKGPKFIKVEEYGCDRTLDPVELFYYTENDILTNEQDEIIDPDTATMLIGDALTKFGFKSADNPEDVICVRNERQGCDYMVTKIRSAYTE